MMKKLTLALAMICVLSSAGTAFAADYRKRRIGMIKPPVQRKRKINQCIEKAPDLCYPFFISLGL